MKQELFQLLAEAWYRRTLPVVDLDFALKLPPPSEEEWIEGVMADLTRHFSPEREA